MTSRNERRYVLAAAMLFAGCSNHTDGISVELAVMHHAGDDPEQGFVNGSNFSHPGMRITFEAPKPMMRSRCARPWGRSTMKTNRIATPAKRPRRWAT